MMMMVQGDDGGGGDDDDDDDDDDDYHNGYLRYHAHIWMKCSKIFVSNYADTIKFSEIV